MAEKWNEDGESWGVKSQEWMEFLNQGMAWLCTISDVASAEDSLKPCRQAGHGFNGWMDGWMGKGNDGRKISVKRGWEGILKVLFSAVSLIFRPACGRPSGEPLSR